SGEFSDLELPEFLLVETVESLDLQRCSIVQHDVEHNGSKQVQRERGGNELLGGLFARHQFTENGQHLFEIRGIAAIGIHDRSLAGSLHTGTVEVDAQNVRGIVHAHVKGLSPYVQRHISRVQLRSRPEQILFDTQATQYIGSEASCFR